VVKEPRRNGRRGPPDGFDALVGKGGWSSVQSLGMRGSVGTDVDMDADAFWVWLCERMEGGG
jgi:hypothetical protein